MNLGLVVVLPGVCAKHYKGEFSWQLGTSFCCFFPDFIVCLSIYLRSEVDGFQIISSYSKKDSSLLFAAG